MPMGYVQIDVFHWKWDYTTIYNKFQKRHLHFRRLSKKLSNRKEDSASVMLS